MPSPKRWFPLSRDANSDPEIWELTDTFGDRSLRLWIEVLSIIDRTENRWRLSGQWLAGLSRTTRQKPASVSRQLDWMVAKRWLTVTESLQDGSPAVYAATNYWKYHRARESNGTKHVPEQDHHLVPSLLNLPNIPNHSSSEGRSVEDVDSVETPGRRSDGVRGGEGFEHASPLVKDLLQRASNCES